MKFCKPKRKSVLSLDIGTKRIGLAYCDPLCITSNILPAVKRFDNNKEIKINRNYINELKLPFSYVNEHSSTWESSDRFGIKKDKSGLIDSFSAKIILEQWIEEGPDLVEIAGKGQIKY